jgi:hypothetical protein
LGGGPALGHDVIYTVLVAGYVLVCAGFGLARGRNGSNLLLSASLAVAMVCAQLYFLVR